MATARDKQWFALCIPDARTRKLLLNVWDRLPGYERGVLRHCIMDISVSDAMVREGVLGSIGVIDPNSAPDEYGIMACTDDQVNMRLHGVAHTKSDAAAMALIAHELAHVILRHNTLSGTVAMQHRLSYTDQHCEDLYAWHEDHADLQVWCWGFQKELIAFYEEYPESRRPRWYQKVSWEPLSECPETE